MQNVSCFLTYWSFHLAGLYGIAHVVQSKLPRKFHKMAGQMWQTGVNFINVLRTNFLYEGNFSSYVLALSKNLYEKFARLTLMRLTEGVDFYNIYL
jgi:hypothetical protein